MENQYLNQESIDLCLKCAAECAINAEHCKKEGLDECARLCTECAIACDDVVYKITDTATAYQQCVEACYACAEECEKHENPYCTHCAEVCRECEEECSIAA